MVTVREEKNFLNSQNFECIWGDLYKNDWKSLLHSVNRRSVLTLMKIISMVHKIDKSILE